jgi:hypothetical protein
MNTKPFFIILKWAEDRIRDRTEPPDTAWCLNIYHVMRRLANDAGAADGPIQRSIGLIAYQAGCKHRRTQSALKILAQLGIIGIESVRVEGTKGRAPSIYTFLPEGGTSGTELKPNDAEKYKETSERIKEMKKGQRTEPIAGTIAKESLPPSSKAPSWEEWRQYATELGWPESDARSAFDHYEAVGWRKNGGLTICDWRAAARNCQRRCRHPSRPTKGEFNHAF